jgi:hypothetical protein
VPYAMPYVPMRKIMLILCFTFLISGTLRQIPEITANDDLSTYDVDILFIMDHNYGANYHFIRQILEQYGWNVTITGLFETLEPCNYQIVLLL